MLLPNLYILSTQVVLYVFTLSHLSTVMIYRPAVWRHPEEDGFPLEDLSRYYLWLIIFRAESQSGLLKTGTYLSSKFLLWINLASAICCTPK